MRRLKRGSLQACRRLGCTAKSFCQTSLERQETRGETSPAAFVGAGAQMREYLVMKV